MSSERREQLALGAGLMVAGAMLVASQLERWLLRRKLQVLDGAAAGGDIDLGRAPGPSTGRPERSFPPSRVADIVAEGAGGRRS